MKKILFATENSSKAKRFSKGLAACDIEVVSLKDLGVKIDVVENGKNAIENAIIKARAGYQKTHLPTIGMDDSLFIDNIPDELQPGLYVRRVGGKTLTEKEMIEYYTGLVKKFGQNGKLNCKWVYGLAVISSDGKESTYTWNMENFYLVDKVSSVIKEGSPLNSISKYKVIDKYLSEVTEEEQRLVKVNEDHVVKFIAEHI